MRRTTSDAHRVRASGFTLVELIVSIALIGLLSMAAIPLLKLPLEGWMDATRRSTLTTELDLIHTKLQDDMAHALPGSVRLRSAGGGRRLLEYLEVRASGHYRTEPLSTPPQCPSCSGTAGRNDILETSCSESCFVNLSPWENNTPPVLAATDWVVVNPMQAPGPYATGLRSQALAVNANGRVDMTPHTFASLPLQPRFYIVTGPVTYDCNPTTRRLTRYWNYPIAAAQPATFTGNSATLSARVASCSILFQAVGGPKHGVLVNLMLRLDKSLLEPQTTSTEVADLQASFAVGEIP